MEVRLNRRRRGRWDDVLRRLRAGETSRMLRKLVRHAYAVFSVLRHSAVPQLTVRLQVEADGRVVSSLSK
jgi:hypothetical protein